MRDARGRFLPGPDPARHRFTRLDCQRGFWRMVESITERYPEAYHPLTGTHMVKRALPALLAKRSR